MSASVSKCALAVGALVLCVWPLREAVAQTPRAKAVLRVQPEHPRPGDFILIDGSASVGGTLVWKLSSDQLFMVGEGRRQIATGAKAGTFTVGLAVVEGDDVDLMLVEVRVAEEPAPPAPPPSPPPVPPVDDLGSGARLATVLTGATARADATIYAEYLETLAARLESDGAQAAPQVTRRGQVVTLLTNIGQAARLRVAGHYPGFATVCAEAFAAHFPNDEGALLPADRQAAVRVLRALAAGCRKAGGA